jgi:hypothetical protein
MYYEPIFSRTVNKIDVLPPMAETRAVKNSEKWQKAVMDAFEYIGREQFYENSKFWDYYRMEEGKLSFQDLREIAPQMDGIAGLLNDVELNTWVKNYDLISPIIRDIVAKLIDSIDKFHITDTGEIAENEFLRHYNDQMMKVINDGLEREIKLRLAQRGFDPDTNKDFQSPEEQQQYLQQLEAETQNATPEEKPLYEKPKFKTIGMKWAEHTMEKDFEEFQLKNLYKNELKNQLLSGRWFREYKIGLDFYKPIKWDPRNTFFSKEIDAKYPQDGNYVGRIHFMTPQEVIKKYHEHIPTDVKKKILGGNEEWKNWSGYGNVRAGADPTKVSTWLDTEWVPFNGFHDYNFALGIQDAFGVPMGETVRFDPKTGEQKVGETFLSRYHNSNSHSAYHAYASVLRNDFRHRRDLCQVTEAYFIAEDYYGILTYRTESGLLTSVDVTEDILDDFLKENKIKQNFKSKLVDSFELGREIREEDENTIKWFTRPVCYEGVKIASSNMEKDIYLYCRPCKHQIKGQSDFDIKLPVAGYIGNSYAHRVMPYQNAYNLIMNQIFNMLEKEIGMFFLMDVAFIPSDIAGAGDAQEAFLELRNIARDFGIMPISTSGDAQKNATTFNQFATQNLSYAPQIQYRIQLAEVYKRLAYETLGANPQAALQPSKYETAEGVRVGNEASFSQVSEIFEDFNSALKNAWELHLSVAQYAQSNKKDHSLVYTKSDGSLAFLQISDPNLPLRRLGLVPTFDSKKRKERESYKQWLLQTNTIGADPLDVAKLLYSDSSLELIEMAKQAVKRRMEQEELVHKRGMEMEQQKAQLEDQNAEKEHQRTLLRNEKNNETKVAVAQLVSLGRGVDNDASKEGLEMIQETAQDNFKIIALDNDKEIKTQKIESDKYKTDKSFEIKMQELKLKTEELRTRKELKDKEIQIAAMNKN